MEFDPSKVSFNLVSGAFNYAGVPPQIRISTPSQPVSIIGQRMESGTTVVHPVKEDPREYIFKKPETTIPFRNLAYLTDPQSVAEMSIYPSPMDLTRVDPTRLYQTYNLLPNQCHQCDKALDVRLYQQYADELYRNMVQIWEKYQPLSDEIEQRTEVDEETGEVRLQQYWKRFFPMEDLYEQAKKELRILNDRVFKKLEIGIFRVDKEEVKIVASEDSPLNQPRPRSEEPEEIRSIACSCRFIISDAVRRGLVGPVLDEELCLPPYNDKDLKTFKDYIERQRVGRR